MKVFHGTAIHKPERREEVEEEIIFDNLETGYSDLNTIWFSENDDVAKHFAEQQAKYSHTESIAILVELELELDEDKVMYHDNYDPIVEIDEAEYHSVADREELYEALQNAGYEAYITENNYPQHGDNANDIAVFDEGLYKTESVRVFHNGKWSAPIKDEETLVKVLEKAFFNKNKSADNNTNMQP